MMFDLTPWRRKREELATATWEMDFRREFDDFVHRVFGKNRRLEALDKKYCN